MLRSISVATAFILVALVHGQDIKVEKYSLSNGLTVLLHEDHSLPVVSLNIWYKVGSKDEPPQRSGFAHLFEHLMFMGTHRVPTGQFDKIMEGGGGQNNANTTEDRTDYFSDGPAALLPTLIWLDADRMEDLGKAIDQKKLDLQRDVVKNERRQNTENTPYGRAYEAINGLMFPPGHPYHNSVIGSMEDLDRASVKDVQGFFASYYTPNNAILAIAGDFDPVQIKAQIASYFGTIPRSADPAHAVAAPVRLPATIRVTMPDDVQASKTIMVWHSPAAYAQGDTLISLAGSVLSDGLNSRLYQRLVVKDKIATDVSASQDSHPLGSLFYIDATAAQGASLDKLEAAIDDVLRDFARKGPTSDELHRQANKFEFGIVNGLQSVHGKAERMVQFEAYLGDPNGIKQVLGEVRKATPAGVREVVSKNLDPNARLILRVVPNSAVPEKNPRDERPATVADKPFTVPAPTSFTLSNGIKVFFWSRPELPLMSASLQLKQGADIDPAGKAGLASLTASMLDEGAGARTGEEFERALDNLGAQFGASSGMQSSNASITSLAPRFGDALKLFSDAIVRPRFDPASFARVQRVTAEGIEQSFDDPDNVARLVSNREFFGEAHPFGRPTSGTPASVRAITVDDLRAEHAAIFRPENATLFVAGSLPEATVKEDLEKALGAWHAFGNGISTPAYGAPTPSGLRVVIVDRPKAVQTVIRFTMPAPPYGDPRREALQSLSTALGGTFTSRLNQNLREDKGYTYGAGSSFRFVPQFGTFTAAADVRADVTGASLKEFLAEFAKIRKGDISPAEASKVASTRRAETIASLGSIQGILAVAEGYALVGRPFGDVASDLTAVSALDAIALNAVAEAGVATDQALLVLVGDRKAIEAQISSLGLPKPTVVTPQ